MTLVAALIKRPIGRPRGQRDMRGKAQRVVRLADTRMAPMEAP